MILFIIFAAATISLLIFSFGYNIKGDSKLWLKDTQTAQFLKIKGITNERIINLGSAVLWEEPFEDGWVNNQNQFLALMESLVPNLNVIFKLNHASTYPIIQTKRGITFNSVIKRNIIVNTSKNTAQLSLQARDLLDLGNVKYIVSPFPINSSGYSLVFNTNTDPQFFIYENQTVIPGVFLASNWVLIPDLKKQYQVLMSGDVNFKKTAIVEQEIPELNIKHGEARILKSGNQDVEISAKLDGDGLLVLADSYYPGWKVTVDGREDKILPVNVNQRGVFLQKGDHTVKFNYQPESFKYGLIISSVATAFILLGILILVFRRRHIIHYT